MRSPVMIRPLAATAALLVLGACSGDAPRPAAGSDGASDDAASDASPAAVAPSPLILAAEEGERRTWRFDDGFPFVIKVDRRNGGSQDLVMGYEEIPPGVTIPAHRHRTADEIIFVHRGSGVARVGSREGAFTAGATLYIPRDTVVTVENTGDEPLAIAFVFSAPGFEEYLRDMSVPEGEPVPPLTAEELAEIQARHRGHTVFE